MGVALVRATGLGDVVDRVNVLVDMMNGNKQGRLKLYADDGDTVDPIHGSASAGSAYAVDVKSAAGVHLRVLHSTGSPTLLDVVDAGVTVGPMTVAGDLTFSGNARRILGNMSDATRSNRLALQSSTVNGVTTFGVLPNGTATISAITAYNSSNPNAASFGEIIATSADVRISSDHVGASYLPLRLYTNNTLQVEITTAGLVKLTTALTIGATPSTTGAIRLSNNTAVSARDSGNSADVVLVQLNGSNQTQVGPSAASDVIVGASDSKVGFFGGSGAVRASALTLTYSTANRTHANPTAATVSTTGATNVVPYGFTTSAQPDSLIAGYNALVADVANIKQFVNAIAGDLIAYRLEQ